MGVISPPVQEKRGRNGFPWGGELTWEAFDGPPLARWNLYQGLPFDVASRFATTWPIQRGLRSKIIRESANVVANVNISFSAQPDRPKPTDENRPTKTD